MKTKDIVFCGIVTALMCVLCPLAIPVAGIPITFATLVIYIIAAVCKPQIALIGISLFVISISLLNKSIVKYAVGIITGTLFLYICGCTGYKLYTGSPISTVLSVCILPFLPGDIVKIIFAVITVPKSYFK